MSSLRDAMGIAGRLTSRRPDPDLLHNPDPELVEAVLPLVGLLERYFRAEVRGLERMPEGPALLVGNHNAGITFLEPFIFGKHYRERFGRVDIHALAHDALWKIPVLDGFIAGVGAVRASHATAAAAFEAGHKVAVWPGGNHEAFRPWKERHRVDFGGHKGFVRLALRHGVDIVPLLCLGGHEAFFVLRRGERIARLLGAKRWLRSEAWPIFLGLPWGIGFGPLFHLPLPTKVIVEVGEPIEISAASPGLADDEAHVDAIYAQVQATLQDMMDRCVAELARRRRERGPATRWLPLG
jgi:1-acyl-sn-glycerol-3-phosphate acyltransferase